ncbi:hypothetical protein COL154_000770 [Colletotrichum chrysophilum]|uniref:uncharacterized protein n=1 Tax=Colletotrichum chrysophilum TaxID=1836956 RepID=UPI002301F73B|nr:uncharacterized protein COL26b_000977 [Colletotrichum chrysophilum]KAI8276286.1 hypothetical protein K4K60_007854 [Colletotrichum sp. SAR11_57]KAJ0355178.1 hypothetical protein KNSL1_000898 [Colletotrichum chrysophilum]KAJ0371259.1 hypothetical protein COL154_000770 [Colletotrichum chrysophilum]KAJ0380691.1 hypothetical protein COL26b_000977 [Colletotrichum chrysophilum]
MDPVPKAIEKVQASLQPYIKPREQVAYIRRALALHLQACGQPGPIQSPLSLIDASCTITPTKEARGLQREYLRALDANIKARNDYENTRNDTATPPPSRSKIVDPRDQLEDHIALVKLRQKQQRLQTVQKYLDLLVRQPAASPDFLDLEVVFRDSPPLPDVPTAVVNSFTVTNSSATTDLSGLAGQLEKVVLRAKLLLQREEQLLQDVRQRTGELAGQVSDEAKAHALDTTRAELINWIETELSKASGEGEDDSYSQRNGQPADKTNIDEKLVEIRDKYTRYTAARKSLLHMVSDETQPILRPGGEAAGASQSEEIPPAPTTHLLIPYLEKLLALSREQKGMIAHKSHVNNVLSKQAKETQQALDHLAEESQLLPEHPMPKPRPRSGFADDFASAVSEKQAMSERVKPWVFAADSAKIATLEAVAEKIEEGQVALEGSMSALQEVDRLLGQNQSEKDAVGDTTEEDIWLTQGSASQTGARRHGAHQRKESAVKSGDIWSAIHGDLGLIGHEDHI